MSTADPSPPPSPDAGPAAARPDDLGRPEAYPGLDAAPVERIETHVSHLFLTPTRVFKLKKPVRLPFVDQSTAAARRAGCEAELRLNRRLAPTMYLGLRDVVRGADGRDRVRLDGAELDGAVVDAVVEMVRLPADGMLDARLRRGALDDAELRAVCDLLVAFHARADGSSAIAEHGTPERVRHKVLENVDQLAEEARAHTDQLPPQRIASLRAALAAFCDAHRPLLARRVDGGRIREGHGDLHAGNVCIANGEVFVYDCVEFDLDLRADDVACDLAFLVMDLRARGHEREAARVVELYAEASADTELDRLVPFYEAHRAAIRAKVAVFAAHQHEGDEQRRALDEAHRYLELALAVIDADGAA